MNTSTRAAIALLFGLFSPNLFGQFVTQDALKVGDFPPPLVMGKVVQGPSVGSVTWEKLRGKVVVLEFWNTACSPCVQAIPHLNELVEQFNPKPVVFLSLSDDNPDYLKQFLHRKPIKGWFALDAPFDPTRTAFHVHGIPTTFIIDRLGRIAAITHPAKLEAKYLEEILAGKPSSLSVPEPDAGEGPRPVRETAAGSNPPPTEVTVSIRGPFPIPARGAFNSRRWNKAHTAFEAQKACLQDVLADFFGVSRSLVLGANQLPEELYDISVVAPQGKLPELQACFAEAFRTNLGVSLQLAHRELEVYVMTLRSTNVAGLKPVGKPGGGGQSAGGFQMKGTTMDSIASFFEMLFGKPVVNETKLSGFWGADIKWKMSEAELLPERLDDGIWRLLRTNAPAITSGNLPPELRDKISRHDLKLLQAELAKPDEQQFQPDRANVIKAAREQLGVEIKPARRNLPVVVIHSAK